MQDFGLLSSKTVTEVLMLEMKMAPTAKTYLVSGFPRNMRDVVEYSEKVSLSSQFSIAHSRMQKRCYRPF
jgi:adenylate kinase